MGTLTFVCCHKSNVSQAPRKHCVTGGRNCLIDEETKPQTDYFSGFKWWAETLCSQVSELPLQLEPVHTYFQVP